MKKTIRLSITFLLLTTTLATMSLANCQTSPLTAAQDEISNAYNTLTAAYTASADINPLIEQLNLAVNLTEQAQQLTTNNSQQAETLANQALSIAQNVTQQAKAAQQSAANTLPIVAIATAVSLILGGVAIYFIGPKIFWRLWFKLRKNYRLNVKANGNKNALVITAEQVCAIALAVTVLLAFISVSGLLIPRSQGEQFSELGILGPNMQLGDYPSQVVASDTIHLYGYVGNQMGQPMYYTVMVKLGDNNTAVNPADIAPIQQYSQVIANNQTWTFPVNLKLTEVGDNQRLLFELWTYNQTINTKQYHERWGQIWLNVTAPAS